MMKRHLSGPALTLLNQSSIPPEEVDKAIDDLVRMNASAVLRSNHPILQRVRRATDIAVVQIARRSRYILVEIEQQDAGAALWQYRELMPRHCTFSCPGQLPATIEVALQGELLERLVIPTIAMKGIVIDSVSGTGDGWLSVDVTPQWHLF